MNHGDVKKNLADYLEGDLVLDDRALVDAHLDHCDECAREVSDMQQTIRLLRLMPEPETPPMIAANVMRRIRAGETRPGFFGHLWSGLGTIFEPSFVLPASAVAAAALVVVLAQGQSAGGLPGFLGATRPDPAERAAAAERGEARATRVMGLDSFGAAVPTIVSSSARPKARTVARDGGRSQAAGAFADRTRAALSAAARLRIDIGAGGGARSGRAADPNANSPGRVFFLDPILTQPIPNAIVPRVVAANRNARAPLAPAPPVRGDRVGSASGAVAVSQMLGPRLLGSISSGGEDPRDGWLARGLEDPVNFAHFISSQSLAEQELWVDRLSERADARGLLGELVLVLQESGDETASWLADDFLARAEQLRNEGAAIDGPAPR
ncbi:MAG: hypothetical protein GY910_14880 [bacterium]|nr:hypothetical protein [Deltaproteobacteria bacterium]MCP4906259.1 hypothetical protein [bacterium]